MPADTSDCFMLRRTQLTLQNLKLSVRRAMMSCDARNRLHLGLLLPSQDVILECCSKKLDDDIDVLGVSVTTNQDNTRKATCRSKYFWSPTLVRTQQPAHQQKKTNYSSHLWMKTSAEFPWQKFFIRNPSSQSIENAHMQGTIRLMWQKV